MGGLFGGGSPSVPTPTVTAVQTPIVNQEQVDRNTADITRRRKGTAATVLTGADSGTTAGSVASNTLLGQ